MPVSHVGMVVVDLPAATEFYLAALAPLGYRYIGTHDDMIGLGVDKADFFLRLPSAEFLQDESATFAPMHIAFRANHKREVKNFYVDARRANGLGAGDPAYRRPDESIYNAAVYDPWGNTVEVVYYRNTPPGRSATSGPTNTAAAGAKSANPSSATVNSTGADKTGRADKLSSKEKLGMTGAGASGSKLNVGGGGSKRSGKYGPPGAAGNRSSTHIDGTGPLRPQNQKAASRLPSKHGFLDTIVDVATTAAAACFAWKNGQAGPGNNQRRDGRRNGSGGGGPDYMRFLDLLPRNRSSPSMQGRPGSGMNGRAGGSSYWDRPGAYDGMRSRQSSNRSRDDFDNRGVYDRPPPRGARSTNDLSDNQRQGYGARTPSRGARRSYFGF